MIGIIQLIHFSGSCGIFGIRGPFVIREILQITPAYGILYCRPQREIFLQKIEGLAYSADFTSEEAAPAELSKDLV